MKTNKKTIAIKNQISRVHYYDWQFLNCFNSHLRKYLEKKYKQPADKIYRFLSYCQFQDFLSFGTVNKKFLKRLCNTKYYMRVFLKYRIYILGALKVLED